MKLKICGMNLNIAEVSELQPDYLGFIFYEKSPRKFDNEMPILSSQTKKVGVFVDAEIDEILAKIHQFDLKIIQLHGKESGKYCSELKEKSESENIEIWKVFSIKDTFDFSLLKNYEPVVDKFLFDTKGKNKGGNGYTFNWAVLKEYPSQKPFILSGGIGIEEVKKIKGLEKTGLPLYAVDVNSKFEVKPGLKDVEMLRRFKEEFGDLKDN